MSRREDLDRIREALRAAGAILVRFAGGDIEARHKSGGSPVTEADLAVDEALRGMLPRGSEGWLSEETADDPARLAARRVWVVDPLDGTREFVTRIPEWCVSVGLVEDGEAVAGGIFNPVAGHEVIGAVGEGVFLNGGPAGVTDVARLAGALVLASRSEVTRGEWKRFEGAPFTVQPVGSVAYKLSMVAAGLADATWTLVPKHEWDVAAGAALVRAAGGEVRTLEWDTPRFNRERPKLAGLVACGAVLAPEIRDYLRLGAGH